MARGSRQGTTKPAKNQFLADIKKLFAPIKLPGLIWFVLGLVTRLPDWLSDLDFWNRAAARFGGGLAVLSLVVGSPFFGGGLMVAGISYLLLVGEPKRTVRSVWWVRIGWIVTAILFLSVCGTLEAAYVGKLLRPERHLTASQREILGAEGARMAKTYFKDGKPIALSVAAADNPETNAFAIEIIKALGANNKMQFVSVVPGTIAPIPMRVLDLGVHGISIQTHDPKKPPPLAIQLHDALGRAGIPAAYGPNLTMVAGAFMLAVGPP